VNTLDDFLQREFELEQLEAVERERRLQALRDPFKRQRTEPGRARVRHGNLSKRTPSPSLGGRHS
jgi:hypothetical protein